MKHFSSLPMLHCFFKYLTKMACHSIYVCSIANNIGLEIFVATIVSKSGK